MSGSVASASAGLTNLLEEYAARLQAGEAVDVASGQELAVLKHKGQVNSVFFSPDGRSLASWSSDFTAWFWESASGREL